MEAGRTSKGCAHSRDKADSKRTPAPVIAVNAVSTKHQTPTLRSADDSVESITLGDGCAILFPAAEHEAATVLQGAYGRAAGAIEQRWGLDPPARFRILIMTSWYSFLFNALPWYTKIAVVLLLPILFPRYRRVWQYVGGWTLRNKRNPVAGVKPPRLLVVADTRIGEQIFHREADLNLKMSWIFSHELTHVFSAHLHLPLWLNEGIAMVSADDFLGRQMVRQETIQTLQSARRKRKSGTYEALSKMKNDDIVYQYVRGYWITRYLMDFHGELLREILERRFKDRSIDKKLAGALGIRRRRLWKQIDDIVYQHFERNQPVQSPATAN